jgi:hypothetical protein
MHESIRYIQNGFEDDNVTPKMVAIPLSNRQSAQCDIGREHGAALTMAFAGIDPRLTLKNANGDINDVSLGLQTAIDTITYLRKQVVTQSFYEVAMTEYGVIEQGDGAYMQNILVTREVDESDDFEAGNLNQGANAERMSEADSQIDGVNVPLRQWGKAISWTLFEVQQALQRNNWDLISARMRSRKRNWDLGIQRTFFLGSLIDTNFPGLLNNPNITVQNSLPGGFTQLINSLDAADFQTFVADVVQAYQANAQYTKYPDYFIIPSDDFNGLGSATSSSFPIGTKLKYLEETFKGLCGQHFRILASAYGVPANNTAWGLNKHLYLLGKMDGDSGHMNIPVDMLVTAPGTSDNFNYRSVGYGQYSGYNIFRNTDFLAFQF